MKNEERQKSRKRNLLMALLFVIFAAVFIFSLIQLIGILRDYNEGKDIYSDIRESYLAPENMIPRPTKARESEESREEESREGETLTPGGPVVDPDYAAYEHETKLKFLHTDFDFILVPMYIPDFSKLLEMNPEFKGWITIEGTHIDYPVVQGENNEKYLRTAVSGEMNNAGSVFIDFHIQNPFFDRNTILHAHNQRNGQMFHDLIKYADKEFWAEHPYIKVYLPDGRMLLYRIYSAYVMKDTRTYQYGFASDESYRDYLDYTVRTSVYDTGIVPETWQSIITLSTCTNRSSEGRYVVHGVLLEIQ